MRQILLVRGNLSFLLERSDLAEYSRIFGRRKRGARVDRKGSFQWDGTCCPAPACAVVVVDSLEFASCSAVKTLFMIEGDLGLISSRLLSRFPVRFHRLIYFCGFLFSFRDCTRGTREAAHFLATVSVEDSQ